MNNVTSSAPASVSHWRRLRTLYLLLAVCFAPVVASYYLYYVAPPSGRVNYGDLVQPQRPLPELATTLQDGTAYDLRQLRGNWVMVMVDAAPCEAACQKKLWQMRQVRAVTGKNADRIERVFLVTNDAPLETMLMREYDGTHFLRAQAPQLQRYLELPAAGALADHIWLIDPISNQMLRWPKDAEPKGIKKDLERLLKASRIG